MSRPTFINSTVVYNDHSTEYNIDARGNKDIDALIRACNAEDVTPEQEVKKAHTKSALPFLVLDKLTELGTYTLEEFDEKYHKAVKGGAPKLAKFLKRYNELEVFDFEDRNKKEIFEDMKSFFGDEMDFGYPNFAAYY